jgi:translation elongation factor EF-Tu-like GTPase
MNPGTDPRVAVVPFLGADGAGKTSLHRALGDIVRGRDGLPAPPLRAVQVGQQTATVLDAKMPYGYLQLVDFPTAQVEESLLGSTGASAALLVVSATDAVLPPTVRSLEHARELHIERMAVAITRCDLVEDQDLLDLVTMETREVLNKYRFSGEKAPVLCVSVKAPMGGDGGPLVGLQNVLDTLAHFAR